MSKAGFRWVMRCLTDGQKTVPRLSADIVWIDAHRDEIASSMRWQRRTRTGFLSCVNSFQNRTVFSLFSLKREQKRRIITFLIFLHQYQVNNRNLIRNLNRPQKNSQRQRNWHIKILTLCQNTCIKMLQYSQISSDVLYECRVVSFHVDAKVE